MQARQSEIDRIVEQQQQTAIILERVLGRLDGIERWQQAEDRAKEREEEHRTERDDKRPDDWRNWLGMSGGCLASMIYAAISALSLLVSVTAIILTIVRR